MPFSSDRFLSLCVRVQKLKEGRICNLYVFPLEKKAQMFLCTIPSNNNKNNNKLQLHFSWKCLYFVVPGRW